MERVLLLKTQLVEAAKLADSSDFAKQRLAVILLDNFIEIQLSELMKKKFLECQVRYLFLGQVLHFQYLRSLLASPAPLIFDKAVRYLS